MSKRVDITGMRFGMLTVVKREVDTKSRRSTWLCRCDCGKEKVMELSNIRVAKSCGCLRHDKSHNHGALIHGDSRTRLYGIWKGMKSRCSPNSTKASKYYSDRGIGVCDEWKEWIPFKTWALENGYSDDLSLDRINGDGDYEPGNCRWADKYTQANNLSTNVHVVYRGVDYTIGELARAVGIPYQQLRDRIRDKHMSVEDAVEKGLRLKEVPHG